MDYNPFDRTKNELRLLTVFPLEICEPQHLASLDDNASEVVQCSLEHFSLNDLKPGKGLLRLDSISSMRRQDFRRSRTLLPSFIATMVMAAMLLLLCLVHTSSRPISHWLGLLYYLLLLNTRSVIGGEITLEIQRAYQRRYFNRLWLHVFTYLMSATGLYAIFLTFTSWHTAVIGFVAGFILEWTTSCFRRALQMLNISMSAILLAEGAMFVPDSRELRFMWGDYIALSYSWGSPDPATMREIVVNGHVVKVRDNLEAFLRRFRCTPEAYAGFKLWVDALCINQEDLQERSHEIKRMRDIYRHAWTVICWLGEEAEKSDLAVDAIQFLGRESAKLQVDPAAMKFGPGPPLFQDVIKPIYRFLSRPYWERLWIIQELAMGDDSTVIMCGSRRLQWEEVYEAARFIASTLGSQRKYFQQELGDEGFADISRLLWLICQLHELLPGIEDSTDMTAMHRILRLGQNAATSEAKDKVYGLLGLLGSEISSRVIPDYSKTVRAVYVDFARSVIEATGSLNIILIGSRIRLLGGWPSWVPDWTLGFDRSRPGFDAPYRASGSSLAHVHFVNMSEQLCCKGFQIAEVLFSKDIRHKKASCWPHRSGHQFGNEETLASMYLNDIKRLTQRSSVDSPQLYNPLTDEAEMEEKIKPRPKLGPWQDTYQHNRKEAFEYFFHGGMSFDLLMGRNPGRILQQAMLVEETLESAFETLANREEVATAYGNRVFATDSEKGDIICILLGCEYPVLLRPQRDGYYFVAQCYIENIMDGQAMEWLDAGECKLEEFILY